MFKKDVDLQDRFISYLLDKKHMIESLHMDEVTEQDVIFYKDIIELLIYLKAYKK